MRPRKEILDDINPKYPNVTVTNLLLLEVLLDIRDLLSDMKDKKITFGDIGI